MNIEVWSKTDRQCVDIEDPKQVSITIRDDGQTIWVNTEYGCLLRICRIGNIKIEDKRKKQRKVK